jgi:hypothetical protein
MHSWDIVKLKRRLDYSYVPKIEQDFKECFGNKIFSIIANNKKHPWNSAAYKIKSNLILNPNDPDINKFLGQAIPILYFYTRQDSYSDTDKKEILKIIKKSNRIETFLFEVFIGINFVGLGYEVIPFNVNKQGKDWLIKRNNISIAVECSEKITYINQNILIKKIHKKTKNLSDEYPNIIAIHLPLLAHIDELEKVIKGEEFGNSLSDQFMNNPSFKRINCVIFSTLDNFNHRFINSNANFHDILRDFPFTWDAE